MQPYLEHFGGPPVILIHDPESPGGICSVLIKHAHLGQLREGAAIALDEMHREAEAEAKWIATMTAIADLAERHGCPPDVVVHSWLLQLGLIDADGNIRMKPDPTGQARDSFVAKIRALRDMPGGAACTEAEAMAAAESAARLMSARESEQADLAEADRGLKIKFADIRAMGRNRPKVEPCLGQLQQLTRCKVYTSSLICPWEHTAYGVYYGIVGDWPEVESFLYLYYLIEDAMEHEYSTYAKAHAGRLGRGAKSSFQIGIANRINLHLARLVCERDAAMQAGGDSDRAGRILTLVTEKQAAIEAFVRSKAQIGG